MIHCTNPILTGCYPDPSICRVGEYFYLVNSTFAYFPGVPIFRSRNLAQWTQIGNVLDRESQVKLTGCGHNEGIYAPTIRWHDGLFYMITTNVSGGGNFIVTAKQPEGPWSEPHYLGEAAEGIDPSLFFDDDGTCYYIGQRANSKGSRYFGDCEIWIQKLNIETFQLEGEAHAVLYGFQKNAIWPEGPHLYKKDGYYYILHAEGGTAQDHCQMAARSRDIFGPYEYDKANPIITHRHLGKKAEVTCVGHADLVEDGRGNWYMVILACRPQNGHTLTGRETFLAKVEWEDGWPVVNPGVGMLEKEMELPGEWEKVGENSSYLFGVEKLPPEFLMLRNPSADIAVIDQEKGCLCLKMEAATLEDEASGAYVALRQKYRDFAAETEVLLKGETENDCAGLAYMQDDKNHYRMEYFRKNQEGYVRVICCCRGKKNVMVETELQKKMDGGIQLKIEVHGLTAGFYYKQAKKWEAVLEHADLCHMSTESAGGFVGCTIGMYASANGKESRGTAEFGYFNMEELIP